MFVYFYWQKDGHYINQAFNREDTAVGYVAAQLENGIGQHHPKKSNKKSTSNYYNMPVGGDLAGAPIPNIDIQLIDWGLPKKNESKIEVSEDESEALTLLKKQIALARKDKSLKSIKLAMNMYDEYNKEQHNIDALIHVLNDLKITE